MLENGTLLQDRFLIEQELARGGMGAVYLATDTKFGSRVAIKERAHETAELAEAFEREARLLNSLHHPIFPHVSDYFSEGDGHFLVMQYIEGEDLSVILKRQGAFGLEDVVRWTTELLDGLDYLHSQDPPVIHRDIKPGNLKLTSRGNIVLLDFGLAKESPGGGEAARSVFGYSRRYSPLEQIEGAGTDARSDIFSLGATVYHLLTGEAAVDAIARASAIVAGRPDPLPSANEVNPNVRAPVSDVVRQAMALDPETRFASANAMRAAFEHAARSEPGPRHIFAAEVRAMVVPIDDAEAEREDVPIAAAATPSASSAATWATAKMSGAAASANAAMRDLPKWVARKRERMRTRFVHGRPRQMSREFVAAVVLAALLAAGFAVYSWIHSSPRTAADPTQADASVASPETASVPEAAPAGSSDQSQTLPEQPEVAAENVTPGPEIAEDKKAGNRSVLPKRAALPQNIEEPDDKPAVPDAKPDRKASTTAQRIAPVYRETGLPDVTTEDPRIVARRARRTRDRVVYQAPASSIETIFTGMPAGRRAWRRRAW